VRLPLRSSLLAVAVVTVLTADDPSWKNKPIAQWDDDDAKQVLADSPWVKNVTLQQVRDLSVAERRDSGDWEAGTGKGVGLAGTGVFGPSREARAIARAHARPDPGTVVVRWESALSVRVAEKKAGEIGMPAWQGDYYAIAVYNVPPPFRWNFAHELKGVAFLKRDKKKDRKPSRVLILHHEDGFATIVYLFSRSAEIIKKDRKVEFVAQIGRLFLAQVFDIDEMEFEGKLDL
jgi:hypothetical protein